VRLEWSRFAIEDRSQIFDYIELDNPRAAVAVDERIRKHVAALAGFPEMGRPGGWTAPAS
jgi:toxin ParE1/3/4